MTWPATVSVRGVVKSFGRTRALDGLDLTAGPGITGLLGRNGAGKTTLLRVLATVLAPDAGTVQLLGRDASDPAVRVQIRRRLGYLPQDPGFYRSFTAFEYVDYIAILKEMNDRAGRHYEVRRVLDVVGLTEVAHRRIRALSAGMRRRVAIAQALLGAPALLVLDEPTDGLDPEQRMRLLDVLTKIGERHTAIILASHQTEDLAAVCQQVAVLHSGRIRLAASPEAIAAAARGRVWTSPRPDASAQITWRTGAGIFRNLGNPPNGAQLLEPTLQDAYLLLVGQDAKQAA
jgi:ABC-2 type transport system ATP-binding protein